MPKRPEIDAECGFATLSGINIKISKIVTSALKAYSQTRMSFRWSLTSSMGNGGIDGAVP